jgi:Xaa-Pro dipeptidase
MERGHEASDIPTFHLGLDTFRVPMAMHAASRAKLAELMGPRACGIALLQGGEQQTRYDTDHEPVFRQESYFQYLFGVSETGCFGAISLPTGKATLFVPKLGIDYEVFCGQYPSPADFKTKYAVDEVRYVDELPDWLEAELRALDEEADGGADDGSAKPAQLFLLHGLNTDSGNYAMPAAFPGSDASPFAERTDLVALFGALAESRVTKAAAEVEVLRYVNWVSSMAHVEVMRAATPGMMEYQLESLFQHHTYTHGGCRHMAYTCICACGPNPAILHYGHSGRPNDRQIRSGDMALLDMGAEYHCCITCRLARARARRCARARTHATLSLALAPPRGIDP